MANPPSWDPMTNPASAPWQTWDPTRTPLAPAQGTDSGDRPAPVFNLDDNWLHSLGFQGQGQAPLTLNGDTAGGGGTSPELQDWLKNTGNSLQLSSSDESHGSKNLGRLVDSSGNQIGAGQQWGMGNDDAFGIFAALMGAGAGAAAGGAFAGSGAFGSGAAVDGGGGMGLAEGSYPSSLGGGSSVGDASGSLGGADSANLGSDAHLYQPQAGGPGVQDLGNMGGAGSSPVPFQQLTPSNSLGQTLQNLLKSKSLIPSTSRAGSASGSSSGAGGLSAGDRFRQQLMAQSIRDNASQQQAQPAMPGWIGG